MKRPWRWSVRRHDTQDFEAIDLYVLHFTDQDLEVCPARIGFVDVMIISTGVADHCFSYSGDPTISSHLFELVCNIGKNCF